MTAPSDHAILKVDNVAFSYRRDKEFISHLSFLLEEGESIGLIGANGSGKSTVLKLASGILKPASGLVTLWNRPLRSYKNRDRAKLLCYLPQILDVEIPFKVRDIAIMGFYPYETPPSIKIEEALDTVGLSDKSDWPVTNLSGGEKRRAFIAMILVQGAGILLLDEPLANLDIKYQVDIMRLLNKLRKEKGISVLMALHDINMAFQFERVIVMKEGRILAVGSPGKTLTAGTLREAFDLDITVQSNHSGQALYTVQT